MIKKWCNDPLHVENLSQTINTRAYVQCAAPLHSLCSDDSMLPREWSDDGDEHHQRDLHYYSPFLPDLAVKLVHMPLFCL
jgi:hypothetical protein